MDIEFDRIPGLLELLARMDRFSVDSPGREYLAICSDIKNVWRAIHEVMAPMDYDGEGKPADAVIQRIYGTPAYLSYRAAAKELFARPFFDGVAYVEESRRYEQARERDRRESEQRHRAQHLGGAVTSKA